MTVLIDQPATAQLNIPRRITPQAASRRRLIVPAIAIVAVGLCCCLPAVFSAVRKRSEPKRFGVVVPGRIYRSGQISAESIEDVILKYDISRIINLVGNDWNNPDQRAELEVAWKYSLPYRQYPLAGDGTGDTLYYAYAVTIMHEDSSNGIPVLVHCEAGSYRTGVAVAYYRLFVEQKPPADVYGELIEYGMKPGSRGIRYINKQMEQVAKYLVILNVIDEVPNPLPVVGPKNAS